MRFESLISVFVFEVDAEQQRSAWEGNCVGQLSHDVVELDAGGGGVGVAECWFTFPEPEDGGSASQKNGISTLEWKHPLLPVSPPWRCCELSLTRAVFAAAPPSWRRAGPPGRTSCSWFLAAWLWPGTAAVLKKTIQQQSRKDWSLRQVPKVSYNTGMYIYRSLSNCMWCWCVAWSLRGHTRRACRIHVCIVYYYTGSVAPLNFGMNPEWVLHFTLTEIGVGICSVRKCRILYDNE